MERNLDVYLIICKDHKLFRSIVVKAVYNYNEAISECEASAIYHVHRMEGDKYGQIIYPKSESGKWGKCPYGHFVYKNSKTYKFTVMNKELIRGYVRNADKVTKVATYEVVKFYRKDAPKAIMYETPRDSWDAEFYGIMKKWKEISAEVENMKIEPEESEN